MDQVPESLQGAPDLAGKAGVLSSPAEIFRLWRGLLARLAGAQSPTAAVTAWADLCLRLAGSPADQVNVAADLANRMLRLAGHTFPSDRDHWAFQPAPDDRRFRYPGWSRFPYDLYAQGQLAAEAGWRALTLGTGVPPRLADRRAEFLGRFALNAIAPVNFPWSNPEVADAWIASRGLNFVRGFHLWLEDVVRLAGHERLPGLDAYVPGKTVAIQPGDVIHRDPLMEVIQYAPVTGKVWRQPVLIVPAWLMKFYVLDLDPRNSLVRHLVEHGHTVFMVSWKNPGADMADIAFEDYRRHLMRAIDAVGAAAPDQTIHLVGYCLGGTLAAIAAAAMSARGDKRLASLSLWAAQTDFSEVGDMMLFVDDAQVDLLDDLMHLQGFLDTRQMSTAFYALRANEMLFARIVERYLLGRAVSPVDIDAWLADPTRIPARAHGDYLRTLFLDNRFARGSYDAGGIRVGLADIDRPVFLLGAERDHVAPWRSVFRTAFALGGDATFVLTGGGHNTGVVTPPGKPKAKFRMFARQPGTTAVDPDAWVRDAETRDGSWWPAWTRWLASLSPPTSAPPPRGAPSLGPAPGLYVTGT